ncbi:tyrosine-type recombinase/integrase [Olsenella profusa]|uniref:Site-specific recombinase, phage integrase family n=1 Tax=Olsenella profusa F0195 TaxID=1125712 RepID=U2V226_9ACTN|nr:site-specific integrase [Olsenella profusa]ERL06731.1 site-specific recombinase, phage integrase family [Olsenella profusa F0195]
MRDYSSGTVRKMRGRWQCVLRYREGGEWRTVTSMTDVPCPAGDEGRRAAEERLRRWRDSLIVEETARVVAARYEAKLSSLASGQPTGGALSEPFADYAVAYVEADHVSRRTGRPIEESTRAQYLGLVRNCMVPALAEGVTVAGVTPGMVEGALVSLQSRGLSASTVRKAFNLMSSVFAHACSCDGLARNPCEGLRAPSPGRPRLNSLAVADADRLARELSEMAPTRGVAAARIVLACGLREGELAGLQLGDIDRERTGCLHVERAIGSSKGRGRTYVKPPKSSAGTRQIPLNGELRSAIHDATATLTAACEREGVPLSDGLYLLGHVDGTWTSPTSLGREWAAVSRSLGLVGLAGKGVTLHDLRHTFATCALARGARVKDVQAILGHSSAQMTLDVYASSDPAERARTMGEISRL